MCMYTMRSVPLLPLPSKIGLSLEVPEDTFPAHRLVSKPLDLAHWLSTLASADFALVLDLLISRGVVTRRLNRECLELSLLDLSVYLFVGRRRSRWSWRRVELRRVVIMTPMLDLLHNLETTNSFGRIIKLAEGYETAEG